MTTTEEALRTRAPTRGPEPARCAAVEADSLARRFGARWVLRGVTVRVEPGEAVALLGRNGSGKTTLLRVLATLLRPSRGEARVCGHDVLGAADRVRAEIGFLAHAPGLYEDLTAAENLRFAARMGGPERADVQGALERVGLLREAGERVRGFSSGMRRRLALGRLLLRPAQVLLLDEPYASFDPEGIALVNDLVRETAGRGGAVLLATHDLPRAGEVVSRVLRLESGRLVELAPPGERSAAHVQHLAMGGGDA